VNHRRARDRDGREIPPATVGTERAAGVHLVEIWCGDCHHHAEISTRAMPTDLAIPDICLRYRCSQCGGRNLTSRPSVLEHYAVLAERTGQTHGNGPLRPRVAAAAGAAAMSPTVTTPIVITTLEQYEAATARIQELSGAIEGSPEEAELERLADAVMAWDRTHDDATSWS
jgi:hypothetical protein